MKKRIVSLLLAVSMILTFLPVGALSAFAAGVGDTFDVDGLTYKITGKAAVSVVGPAAGTTLTQVVIPSQVKNSADPTDETLYSVTEIGAKAFSQKRSLQSVVISDSVERLGNDAFFQCEQLESVTFGENSKLRTIGDSAFAGCYYKLQSIDIPRNVESIGNYVFDSCFALQRLTFQNGSHLNTLGDGVFGHCSGLTKIKVPETVKKMGDYTFWGCSKVSEITIPDGVEVIGAQNFNYCSDLTTINLPNSIKQIKDNAFQNCTSLDTINYDGTKDEWKALMESGMVADTAKAKLEDEGTTVNCHTRVLTVTGGTIMVEGKEINANSARVYVGAQVTVTFNKEAFADSGSVFGYWKIKGLSEDEKAQYTSQESFTFTMPNCPVSIEAMTKDASIDDGDNPLGAAAAVTVGVVGGAALAYQLHELGTEFWLNYHLPNWAVIPQNRIQLAEVMWQDAGCPEPESTDLYEDIDANDADAQNAARWAVENQLMDLPDADKPNEFAPDAAVSHVEAIRAWKKYEQMKKNA